jgi:site-specific DNA-methyltransferase (adenine-specific)/adenine-specific DNA-methyltransferase
MPTLDWIGKKAVVNHHREVPYRLLKCEPKLSVGDPGSGNLLVQGDNLLALKALLPYYAGQVKCIYIDPPYNTGDENWVYNDAVNSPEIRVWLGGTVGKEIEDLSRHDKWLCMMYPRLSLLKSFLRVDGAIFVSIDENELGNLRLLMDEIFGLKNNLGTLVWKRRSSSAMRGTPLSIDHEYVLVYAFDSEKVSLYGLEKGIEGYPQKDERGHYASTDLTVGMNKEARPGQFYPIQNPRTGKSYPPNPERVWRFYPETMQEVINKGLIIWPDDVDGKMERPRFKTYFDPTNAKPKPISSWIESANSNGKNIEEEEDKYGVKILSSGMNQEGGRLLQQILGTKVFAYPKPLSLVKSIIRATTKDKDLVLDSFAGTGTTANAVLDLNQQDGFDRHFILNEMDHEICQNITYERLDRVIHGYESKDSKGRMKMVAGLGGGFRYCVLSEPVFDEHGQICKAVTFADLARHVFFTETGEPLPKAVNGEKSPLIGLCNGTAYYLLFNGVLGDKRPDGGNVLTGKVLASLPSHDGPRVILGEGCRLGADRLKREGIVFKQIPYEIKVN